jgi:hypothetical protein
VRNITSQLDHFVGQVLFVKPPDARPSTMHEGKLQAAENAMSLSFLFVGMRCILQYVVLPFVLPVLGITGIFSTYITFGINVVAIVALIVSVRHLWQINYSRRWQYLLVGSAALVFLVIFAVVDILKLA